MVLKEIEKINEENKHIKNYRLKDLSDMLRMDPKHFCKLLKPRKQIRLKRVISIIAILRCDETTANELLAEAGYDLSRDSVSDFAAYRRIIELLRASEEEDPDRKELDALMLKVLELDHRMIFKRKI